MRNDPEEISHFMAGDWVIIGTLGGITPGRVFLDSIRSGELVHTRMDSDEVSVRIYDNTGIVVSRGTSSGSYKGQPFSDYEWSTSLFLRTSGSWACVLTMLTPAQKP